MSNLLPRVAFWLVPEKNQRARFYDLIKALAERFAAVAFVPHVTVYSCPRTSQQQELAIAAGLAAIFQELTLEIDGLSGSDKLTETLFINFQKSHEIKDIHDQFHASIQCPANYKLHPHLSLLYQRLTIQQRKTLIEEISFNFDHVIFNELWAVAIPEQLESFYDFRGWQPLLTCRLAPRENVDTFICRENKITGGPRER
jgi:2'-5' RNA ligase